MSASTSGANWSPRLTELYRSRFRDLVRVAYLMTGRAGVAEELTQDAFLSAHRHMARVDQPYAYVRRAVVNNARSWHRRRAVEARKRPDPPEPVLNHPDEMWDALQTLEPRRRTAIVLRFYEQLADNEIADILECARPTVRTLIRRGLADLRQEIDR